MRRTTEKMEIATSEPWNPIKQDKRKDGALRYVNVGPRRVTIIGLGARDVMARLLMRS